MSAYKGFGINTNTTPAPWGAREQQMVQDVIDTIVIDTIQGAKDTAGHKHAKVYDPDGNALIEAASTGLTLESDSTGSVAIELFPGQDARIICGNSLIDVTTTEIHIRAHSNVVLDNFSSLQYLFTDTAGVVHQGPFGPDATQHNVLFPATVELQFYKSTTYIAGTSSGALVIETTDNDITIHALGTSSGNINITNENFDINLQALSTGKVLIWGDDITLTAGTHILIPTIPSSSAGLTTGMLWVTSGGALMRMA